ncbi:lipopolysaccharide biosynthesis protein [Paracoccus sp. R86501]|uniref:lipopolysaccharide biosynthesis protein n=1 Tax=Paracoccus sp. R86501 TaxID=3101711 RepID=UPI0036702ED7
MGDIRARLLKGALWVALGRLLASSLGLISTLVLARLLMPEDFGLVAISAAFMAVVTSITEMPVSEALVQHDDPKDDHFHTAFSISVTRGVIMAVLLAMSSGAVAQFYDDERLRDILYVMAIGVFAVSLTNPRLVMFQRELIFHQVFIMQISEKLMGFIVAMTAALIFRSYWALVLGALASEITRVLLSYIFCPIRPRLTFVYWRDLLSFSIWLTLGSSVQALNWRVVPLLYGAILPTNIMGQYSFGNRLTNTIFEQLAQPIQQTLYPAFSRFKTQKDALRMAYLRAQGVMCLWIIPCAIGFAAIAPTLVTQVVGEKWLQAVPVMQILAVTAALQASVAVQPIAMATGNTQRLFYRDIRATLVRWPLILIGIWLGSPQGPYAMLIGSMLGAFVGAIVNVIWNMTLVRDVGDLRIRAQFQLLLRPALASMIMTSVIWLLETMLPPTNDAWGIWIRLLQLCVAGGLSYVITIAVLWRLAGRPKAAEADAIQMIGGGVRKLRDRIGA